MPIGLGVDASAVDPAPGLAFASSSDGAPTVAQDKVYRTRRNRCASGSSSVLAHERFLISATITGNVAVVQCHYETRRHRARGRFPA